MKCATPLFFVLFSACATAVGSGDTPDAQVVSWDTPIASEAVPARALARADVRGANTVIEQVQRDIARLSPEQLSAAAESVRVLSVSCAYTRASLQLPLVMHQLVMAIDANQVNSFMHDDLHVLKKGLSTHVAVLDTLSVDLIIPSEGDYLAGRNNLMVSRTWLLADKYPIERTAALVDEISTLNEDFDEVTTDKINTNGDTMRAATGLWQLNGPIVGWSAALRRIEPFITDKSTKNQVKAMLSAVEVYSRQGC